MLPGCWFACFEDLSCCVESLDLIWFALRNIHSIAREYVAEEPNFYLLSSHPVCVDFLRKTLLSWAFEPSFKPSLALPKRFLRSHFWKDRFCWKVSVSPRYWQGLFQGACMVSCCIFPSFHSPSGLTDGFDWISRDIALDVTARSDVRLRCRRVVRCS